MGTLEEIKKGVTESMANFDIVKDYPKMMKIIEEWFLEKLEEAFQAGEKGGVEKQRIEDGENEAWAAYKGITQ